MIDDFMIYAWQQKVYVVLIKAVLFFRSALGVSHCLQKHVHASECILWAYIRGASYLYIFRTLSGALQNYFAGSISGIHLVAGSLFFCLKKC